MGRLACIFQEKIVKVNGGKSHGPGNVLQFDIAFVIVVHKENGLADTGMINLALFFGVIFGDEIKNQFQKLGLGVEQMDRITPLTEPPDLLKQLFKFGILLPKAGDDGKLVQQTFQQIIFCAALYIVGFKVQYAVAHTSGSGTEHTALADGIGSAVDAGGTSCLRKIFQLIIDNLPVGRDGSLFVFKLAVIEAGENIAEA